MAARAQLSLTRTLSRGSFPVRARDRAARLPTLARGPYRRPRVHVGRAQEGIKLRNMICTAVVGACAAGVPCVADIILDQPSTNGTGYTSQDFTDNPVYTSSCFDDFTIGDTYNLTALRVYGTDQGSSSGNVDVIARIFSTPDLTGVALATVSGTQVDQDLTFDFTGVTLTAGTYWISAQVVRPVSSGQWYWYTSSTTNGAHAMFHNPGGGFGVGGDPVSTTAIGMNEYDMAFTLEGYVPAPGAVAVLAAAGLMRRRRRN